MNLPDRVKQKTEHKIFRLFSVAACGLLLGSCASTYEAPMDDRSSSLERTPPLIVSNGQEVPATQRRRPAIAAASSGTTRSDSSSESIGASTTVVRPVTVGGGIGRTTISRGTLPVDEQPSAATPVASSEPRAQTQTQTQPPVQAQTQAAAARSHTVARGDTLYSIAWTHNIDYRRLALVNNLNAPYTIYPGQQLNLSDSGVSESAISSLPAIPASPAGETATISGQRPQAAIDARRTGSVNTRQVEGVSWQWPADGRMLSMFSESGSNRGVDISGVQGQAVYAAADGDVVYAGSGIQGAGNLVILRHSARHLSAYMYNRDMVVGEGDRVRAGDKIAEMGSGPNGRDMLHFEVRVDGKPTDPVRFLPSR